MNKRLYVAVAVALSMALSAQAYAAEAMQKTIAAALYDLDRPLAQRHLDAERKPTDVILFSGVKPGSKVVEFMPGSGYWTRILSRVAGSKGHVYAYAAMIGPVFWSQAAKDAAAAAGKEAPENPLEPLMDIRNTSSYDNVTAILQSVLAYGGNVGLPEQVDIAVSVDDYHILYSTDVAAGKPADVVAINKAIFRALKPGGRYVVINYAAADGAGIDQAATLRRVEAARVKKDMLAAGFVLDAESDALANPADARSKPPGDPSIRGKADQFLLRFKKPDNAPADKRHPDRDLANYYGNTFHLGPRPRLRIFYHRDHRYQEYEDDPPMLSSGIWYADADGHICLLHETGRNPGFTACHPFEPEAVGKKPGDHWTEYGPDNDPWQVWLEKGITFPELKAAP